VRPTAGGDGSPGGGEAQCNNVHTNINVHKFSITQRVQYRSVLFIFSIVNTVEKKSFNISALTLDSLDNSPWLSSNDPTLTLLLLLLLAYAKKDFLSSLIFLASLDSNSVLAFFIETLACHLPWTMPVALITAADGVYHPSTALIIGQQRRQGRRSIYPDRNGSTECWNIRSQILFVPWNIRAPHHVWDPMPIRGHMICGQDNSRTCQFADKTFRWHANSRTMGDSRKDFFGPAASPQMGGVYCFTALHLYTPPNACSCEQEGAGAALSDINNYEKFWFHWLQQLQLLSLKAGPAH